MTEADRAAFEAWARKTPRYPVHNSDLKLRGTSEDYSNDWVQADWEVWQAATKTERQRCLAAVDDVGTWLGTGPVVAAAIKKKIGEA